MGIYDVLFFGCQLLGCRVYLALCLQRILIPAITIRLELEGGRLMAEDLMLQVAEADDDHGHVVEGPPEQRILEYVLDTHPAELVHVLCLPLDILMVLVVVGGLPNAHHSVSVRHLVEDAVAPQRYEVMVLLDLE